MTPRLKLASFDGGGPRSFSQLIMMRRFMHQLRWNVYPDDPYKVMSPCDHFDLIGGSDTGGIIVIMFTKLKMSVEEAIPAFGRIVEEVYAKGLKREDRTKKLRKCMEDLLTKRGLPVDLKLEEPNPSGGSLGFVMAASSLNVLDKVRLRTYVGQDDPPSNITVVDAALATCASPPEFLPVITGIGYERCAYAGAGIGANNPARQVLSEAALHFGEQPSVLLSLGSGHPGTLSLNREREDLGLHSLMHEMMVDCEREDWEIRQQMCDQDLKAQHQAYKPEYSKDWQQTHLPQFYFRFSVAQGMQKIDHRSERLQWIAAQTDAYFRLQETAPRISEYISKMSLGTESSPPPQSDSIGGNIQGPALTSMEARPSVVPDASVSLQVPHVESNEPVLMDERDIEYITKLLKLGLAPILRNAEPNDPPCHVAFNVSKQIWSKLLWR